MCVFTIRQLASARASEQNLSHNILDDLTLEDTLYCYHGILKFTKSALFGVSENGRMAAYGQEYAEAEIAGDHLRDRLPQLVKVRIYVVQCIHYVPKAECPSAPNTEKKSSAYCM